MPAKEIIGKDKTQDMDVDVKKAGTETSHEEFNSSDAMDIDNYAESEGK